MCNQMDNESELSVNYKVFLGGSCNPTTWRIDIAIPILKKLGITYYNPQVAHWGPELLELESKAKQNAEVLLFVIDNQTRSVASMIEASQIAGSRRKLILVIHELAGPGSVVHGETISEFVVHGEPLSQIEYRDLKQGQNYLQDLVQRLGIPVFDQIPLALVYAAKLLRDNICSQNICLEERAIHVKKTRCQLNERFLKRLRAVFDSFSDGNTGEIKFSELKQAFRIMTGKDLNEECFRAIIKKLFSETENEQIEDFTASGLDNVRVNFDEFCSIITELKSQIDSKYNRKTDSVNGKNMVQTVSKNSSSATVVNGVISSTLTLHTFPSADDFITCQRDIYLGGSMSSWREDIAIPQLKKHKEITYYTPQIEWGDSLNPLEAEVIENCSVLLFTITNNVRSVAPMILAGHYIQSELVSKVVLCIQYLNEDGCTIEGEKMSNLAIKDYNRGRMYLSDLATRVGIPAFDDVSQAVSCCIEKCTSKNKKDKQVTISNESDKST